MSEPVEVIDAPPIHDGRDFVGDLDVSQILVTPQRALLWAPVTDSIRSEAGAVSVGVLATFLDVIASMPTIVACAGDWSATQTLGLHATGWLVAGPVVVDASLVRVGRKSIVVAADVWDGRGLGEMREVLDAFDAGPGGAGHRASPIGPALVARGLITFARLPRGAAGEFASSYDPLGWMGKVVRRRFDPIPTNPIRDRIEFDVIDAWGGVVEVERVPYITNTIGTINGGVLAVAIERAAEEMRPGHVATDLQIQYLSQLKTGPARTRGSISRDTADHSVASVQVLDHGSDDQVLAMATVTLQAPPS